MFELSTMRIFLDAVSFLKFFTDRNVNFALCFNFHFEIKLIKILLEENGFI